MWTNSNNDTSLASATNFKKQLAEEGYLVVPKILDKHILQTLLQKFSDSSMSQAPKDNFGDSGAFLVADYRDPIVAKLLTWPKTLEALFKLGFSDPRLHNFYVSTKAPQAAALAWHSDLFYEYEEQTPAELFLIYYLQDTSPSNGCLRVVPRSHLWSRENRLKQSNNSVRRSGEVDVPLKAGDLFIGDRRILHATHANTSNTWRTCLTIALAPVYSELPEPIKALIVNNQCLPPKGWWSDRKQVATIDKELQKILPVLEQ